MIISRPRWSLILFPLLAATALLPACSGDDPAAPEPDPEPEPTVQINGTVAMPAGWGGTLANLEVIDGAGRAGCGDNGAFALPVARDDTQLAVVLGAGGDPLLLGWMDAQNTELNVHTTAEVLTWYALGAWLLPHDVGVVRWCTTWIPSWRISKRHSLSKSPPTPTVSPPRTLFCARLSLILPEHC